MVTCPAVHPLQAAPHTASTDWWCDCCGATFPKGHPELSPQCWRCEDTHCRHRFCAPCVARRVVCATDHLLSRRLFPAGDKSALLRTPCLRCGRKPINDVDQKTEKATVVLFACEPCATFVCAACVTASGNERSHATTSSNAALAPHPPPQKGHSGSRPTVGTEPQSIIHPHRPADAPARQSPRRARTDAAGPLSVPQETGAAMDPRTGSRLRSSSRASSNSYHDPGLLTPTSSNGTVPPLGRGSSADDASPIGAEDVFLEPQFSCVGGAVMVDSEMFSAASFGNVAPHNAMSGAMRMSSGIDGSPGSVASIGPAVAPRSTPPICPRCVAPTLLLPAALTTAACAVCQDTLRAGIDAAYSCSTSACGYAVCAACSAPPSEAARAAVAATLGVEGLAEGISSAATVGGSRPQQRRRRRERGHSNPFLKQGGGSSTCKCPNGHPLRSAAVLLPWQCDSCKTEHDAGTTAFQCRQCDYDLCLGCESAAATEHSDGVASPASPAETEQQSPFSPVDAKHKLLRPGRKPVDRQRPLVCPASHRLAPQSLQVEWVCDQCGGDYDGGDPGLGCRRCDFDLCLPCAHATLGGRRATRRHMSRRQLPHGTSSTSSAARCPKSHPLQQSPMSVAWRCALCCGNFLPATIPWSCHLCHFEACPGCAAGTDPPSSDSSSSGLDEDAADGKGAKDLDGVTCCAGHPVKPHRKDLPWACDGCLAHHKAHTTSAGCRRCGYDLCSACVAVERAAGQSPMQSPLGGGLGLASAARQQRGSFVKTERPSGACRAVLIGINYEGSASELRGCVNDVRTVMKVVDVLGFRPTERRVLVDDLSFAGRTGHPTHAEILDALRWLCRTAAPGDTLFVHYSGHGGRQVDLDGDESDGYDEALVPVDSDTAGLVTDDDIFDVLCRDLPAGVRLTCLADCCHSGSLLDLQYAWQWDGAEGEAASPASPVSLASPTSERSGSELSPEPSMVKGMAKGGSSSKGAVAARPRRPTREESILNRGFKEDSKKTCAADVVLLSACRDSEKTGDVAARSTARSTAVYTGPGSAGGACTNALVEVLGPAIAGHAAAPCFGDLLLAMQANLRRRRFQQVPMLSASVKVRMQRPFSLFGAL